MIPAVEDRYYIGWFYLGIIAVIFSVNLSVVLSSAFLALVKKFKKELLKCKIK